MCKRWHCGILAVESELASPSTLQRGLAMGSHAFLSRPRSKHQVAGHSRLGGKEMAETHDVGGLELPRTSSGWNFAWEEAFQRENIGKVKYCAKEPKPETPKL